MPEYNEDLEVLLRYLDTNAADGLTADTSKAKLQECGPNQLKEQKKKTNLQRFIAQFNDAMILILLAAAAISFGVSWYEQDWPGFFEPALIVLIVAVNAAIGTFQEGKAERALESLKKMPVPTAKVIRGGNRSTIDAAELVPGDIILLESGDFVPADARLLYSSNLRSEESILTGESAATEKSAKATVANGAPIGDRFTMVFSGCSIAYGTAKAVVTATGMDTEMGKIAGLLNASENPPTPLQQKLSKLGQYLGIGALVICAVIFVVGLLSGLPAIELFMVAVSLAVSAIPEGLPAVVTIVLSIGVQRMVARNAIIRRLPAVETLGSASAICSDKTGTLTQNRMTLVSAYIDGEQETEEITSTNSQPVKDLLMYGALCSDGEVVVDDGHEQHIGDPTETAIVAATQHNGMPKDDLISKNPRLDELPFDSDRKMMAVVNQINGENIVIVKGAFDALAAKCVQGDLKTAQSINEQMSAKALRVIAIAYKKIDKLPETPTSGNLETNLTFMGLVGMIDPPRPEAKTAVDTCRQAGIKPVMITGDHILTATAIAKELGILREDDLAISGAELAATSDAELDRKVDHISVYARVSPEDKLRIVRAWQSRGQVVAMTGDGVNDSPALKSADIGCAMGITGTDVAKNAADMTLTDDNFATIVEAVREGRGIYMNIRKVVGYLLGTNIGEVITVFVAVMFWRETPLLPMQLLWINLVTDSLPAIALGREAVEPDIMSHPPKPKNEGIFAHGLGIHVILQGTMFGVLSLFGFWHGVQTTNTLAGGQTMAFIILATSQIIQAYNMRSDRSLFSIRPFSNRSLNYAALISMALIALAVLTPVSHTFGLFDLPPIMYAEALGLSFIPLVVMEISKAIRKSIAKS